MTDTELREAIRQISYHDSPRMIQNEMLALFQAQKNQLLTEIVGKAVEVNTVQYNYDNGDKVIAGFTNSAVPISVLEQYITEGGK